MGDNIMILCGSIKPPKNSGEQSAAREITKLITKGMDDSGFSNYILRDLREMELPYYDGRNSGEYRCDDLDIFKENMLSADTIVVSIPCYWRSAAGGFVNLMNLFGGPLYDYPDGRTLLEGKNIFIVTIGASNSDAIYGEEHVRNIFSSFGARVLPNSIKISNLREMEEQERKKVSLSLFKLGKLLGMAAMEVKAE